jgi:hypothetical protein
MSDEYRIRPVLNTEYKYKTPRLLWNNLVEYKKLIGTVAVLFAVSIALLIRYDREIAGWFERTGDSIGKSFRNPENNWIYLIFLVILLQIYKKYPKFFAPATVVVVLGVMILLCFQYNNFNSDHVVNKWLIVAAFVVPVIPLIAVMVKTDTKWMHWVVMAIYVCLVALLLIINPVEFLGKYDTDTPTVYVVALIGLFSMICVYLNKNFTKENWNVYITKLGFVLLCLLTAGYALQYAIRFFLQKPDFSANYILMIAVIVGFVVMFGTVLIMRLPRPNMTGRLGKLWLAVFYCYIKDVLHKNHGIALYMLVVEVALIVWYILSPKVYTHIQEGSEGKQVFNEPLSLKKDQHFNSPFEFKANYALSFWVNLIPQPKEFEATGSTFVNLVDYGGKPRLMYNASSNTLRVTVRMPTENKVPNELEMKQAYDAAYDAAVTVGENEAVAKAAGDRARDAMSAGVVQEDVLIADIKNVPLQRWHHIVLAYNNGTFDVFLNGVLYNSTEGVMTDTVNSNLLIGAFKGNRGQICNFTFYQNGIDPTNTFTKNGTSIKAEKVMAIYNNFVNKNPPIVTRVFSVAPDPTYANMRVL